MDMLIIDEPGYLSLDTERSDIFFQHKPTSQPV